jgi:predicted ABC-type ATPase
MSDRPQVIVIAGPNGAGKSTLAPMLLRDKLDLPQFVNADTISVGLSAFNPQTVAFEAGRVMLKRLHDLAFERESFGFESTLAARSYLPWLCRLQKSGYEFHLVYLWLRSVELAIERVAQRVRNGGHSIPTDIIRRRYDRGLSNLLGRYMNLADSWIVLDNSGRGAPLLVATGRGQEQVILQSDAWCTLQTHRR